MRFYWRKYPAGGSFHRACAPSLGRSDGTSWQILRLEGLGESWKSTWREGYLWLGVGLWGFAVYAIGKTVQYMIPPMNARLYCIIHQLYLIKTLQHISPSIEGRELGMDRSKDWKQRSHLLSVKSCDHNIITRSSIGSDFRGSKNIASWDKYLGMLWFVGPHGYYENTLRIVYIVRYLS